MSSPQIPPDDISQPIPGTLSYGPSPDISAIHASIAGVLANVQPAIDSSIGDAISAADNDVSQSVTSNDLAIRQLLGQLSLDADAIGNPVARAIDKLYSDVLVPIAGGLHEIEFSGVRVPFDVKMQQAMLDDSTGEPIINAVMGVDPGVLPNVPDAQLASTSVVGVAQSPPPVLRQSLTPLGDPGIPPFTVSSPTSTAATGGTNGGVANTLPATGRAVPTDITSPPVFVGDGGVSPAIPPVPGITVPPVIGPPGPAPEPEPAPVVPPSPSPPPPAPCHDDMDCRPASEAIICFPKKTGETGTGEEPPPVPPTVPPPPGEEETPPPEPEPIVPPAPEPTPAPAPLPTPIPDTPPVVPLIYADINLCNQIASYVPAFAVLGEWMRGQIDGDRLTAEIGIDAVRIKVAAAAGVAVVGAVTSGKGEAIAAGLGVIAALYELNKIDYIEHDHNVWKTAFAALRQLQWQSSQPNGDALIGAYWTVALIDFAEQSADGPLAAYVGMVTQSIDMRQIKQIASYVINWLAPSVPPSIEEVRALWTTGVITDEHAACLVGLLGRQWAITAATWNQGRTRPNVREVIDLYNRGNINYDQLIIRLADLGVRNDDERNLLYSLSQFVPPYTDLISFMVRDAFDENVARDYQLDKGFTDKFTGQTEAWARAQGISADVFKYNWRSHWKIPSNTQLYEIAARFRPDRPEVIEWDRQQAIATANGNPLDPQTRPPVFDIPALQKALEVNDQAPQFVPFLVGINQHPINPSDAARAYQTGAFNEQQFYHTLRDNQYSDQSAVLRVSIERATKDRRLASATGQGTPRQIAGWYRDGVIDRNTADRFLTPLIIDANQRRDTLDKVDLDVKAATMRKWVARARRAYFTGVWNKDEAIGNLRATGIDADRIPAIIEQWTADLRGRYREPSARQIIQWMQINVITPQDAYQRLINVGYLELDANRIVAQGIVAYSEKIVGQLDKMNSQWRTKIRDARAAKRERDQELKDYQKQIQDTQKKLEQEQKRVEDELRKRGLIP